jgi:myosin heavy subunit
MCRRYLNRSSCYDLPGMDNAEEYVATRQSMSVVGIPQEDQQAIFTVVAAVLHLGNATFTANPNDDSGCLLESERAKQHLMWAAELLQVRTCGHSHHVTLRHDRLAQVCCPVRHARCSQAPAAARIACGAAHYGSVQTTVTFQGQGGVLQVPAQGLHKSLTTRTIQTPEGPINSPITAPAAGANRDALAKTIYARLFDWLVDQVRQCNTTIYLFPTH